MSRIFTVLALALVVLTAVGCSAGGNSGLAGGVDQRGYVFTPYKSPTTANIMTSVANQNGTIFAGGDSGLYRIGLNGGNNTFTKLTTVTGGLNADYVLSLSVDPTNKLWIGTTVGLNSMANGAASATPLTPAGLPAGYVTALSTPGGSRIYAGLQAPIAGSPLVAISLDNGLNFNTIYGPTHGLTGSQTTCIYTDSTDVVACTTGSQGGVFVLNGGTGSDAWSRIGVSLASDVYCFTKLNNVAYVGTSSGLYQRVGTGLTGSWTLVGFAGMKVYWIAVDDSNRTFVTTDQGLSIGFAFTQFRSYSVGNGIPTNRIVSGLCLHDAVWLACQSDGTNLVGGVAQGIYSGN